jgi:hypothetical protein
MPSAPKSAVKDERGKPYTKDVMKISGKEIDRAGVEAFVFISLGSWLVSNRLGRRFNPKAHDVRTCQAEIARFHISSRCSERNVSKGHGQRESPSLSETIKYPSSLSAWYIPGAHRRERVVGSRRSISWSKASERTTPSSIHSSRVNRPVQKFTTHTGYPCK